MNSAEAQIKKALEPLTGVSFADKEKIIRKAAEYHRLIAIRAPHGLGIGQVCRDFVLIDLAAEVLNIEIDRSQLISKCSTTFEIYCAAHQNAKIILKINSSDSSPSFFATKLGHAALSSLSAQLFDAYQKKFLETVEPEQRKFANFSSPVFSAVAFYLVAKRKGKKIDKKKLLNISLISPLDFRNVEASFCKVFETDFSKKKKVTKKGDQKSTSEAQTSETTQLGQDEKHIPQKQKEKEEKEKEEKEKEEKEKEEKEEWIQKMKSKSIFSKGQQQKQNTLDKFFDSNRSVKKSKVEE